MRVLDKSLRVAWVGVLLLLAAAVSLGAGHADGPLAIGFATIGAIGAIGWLFVTVRVLRFHRGLHRFLRRLLASDYDTGMRAESAFNDDLTHEAHMCTRLAEQLRIYDVLRADRVSLSHRALDVVLQSAATPTFLYDVGKQAIRINEALQTMLAAERTRFATEALRDIAGNAPFFATLDGIVTQERVETQVDTRMRLPGSHDAASVTVRFVPLKGRRETVDMVVGFVTATGQGEVAPAPTQPT